MEFLVVQLLLRAFDWASKAEGVACVLETFSDIGCLCTSTKYQGCSVHIQCHCVVMSNRPPLDEIAHRDVVDINAVPVFDSREELEPTQLLGDVLLPSGVHVDRATGRPRIRSRSPVL